MTDIASYIHQFLPSLITVGSLFFVGVTAPGADFALVIRNSINNSRIIGFACALGIAFGVLTTVLFCAFGIKSCQDTFPWFLDALKITGSCYLLYLGYSSFRASKKQLEKHTAVGISLTNQQSFFQGYITTILNPQAFMFIVTTMTYIPQNTPGILLPVFWAVYFFLTLLWYTFVAYISTIDVVLSWFEDKKIWITRITGAALIFFSLTMIISTTCGL